MIKQKKEWFKFMFLHGILLVFFLIILFVSILFPAFILKKYFYNFNVILFAFYLTLFIIFFIYSYIIVTALLCYPFRKMLKQGTHEQKSTQFKLWVIADNLASLIIRPPFSRIINISAWIYIPAFKLFGLKGHFFHYKTAEIIDPWFIEIGENVVLGDLSSITGHVFEKGKLILGKVKMGNDSMMGLNSALLPGTEIGENSILGSFSVVKQFTKIPDNEVWVGLPAKKLKNID